MLSLKLYNSLRLILLKSHIQKSQENRKKCFRLQYVKIKGVVGRPYSFFIYKRVKNLNIKTKLAS